MKDDRSQTKRKKKDQVSRNDKQPRVAVISVPLHLREQIKPINRVTYSREK